MKKITLKSLGLVIAISISSIMIAQPANDICTGAQTITPNGSCVAGTTVGATDTWTSTVGCQSGNPNSHPEVWYTFTSTGTNYTGTVTASGSWSGNVEFTLVSGTCAGSFTVVGSACGASPLSINIGGLTSGTVYYYTISNAATGTAGPFTTCSTTSTPSCTGLTCATPDVITYTTGVKTCVAGCNTGSGPGPDFAGNNCYDYPNATTWYQVTTGPSSGTIDIDLSSSTLNNPYFTVFTTNCITFTTVNCTQGASGSATATVSIKPSTTYLIAVSDGSAAQGNFNLCVTVKNDASACNKTDQLSVSATSMGSPLTGPFKPGEVVTFCYSVSNYTQFNCNYMAGFVPTFGDCWDPVSFDAQGKPVNITVPLTAQGKIQNDPANLYFPACAGQAAGTWSWFPAGAVTYNNITGSLPPNSPLPAGWFFLSSYDPATGNCSPDPTDPDNSYGDSNYPTCTQTPSWNVCFQLQARALIACTNGQTDCSVSMKTYADGEIGVWNSIGCTADLPAVFPATLCCAQAPTGTGASICAGDTAKLSALGCATGTLNWYATSTGGISLGVGNSYNTGVLNTPATYYVDCTLGGCTSPRTAVSVTVNPKPNAGIDKAAACYLTDAATLAGSGSGTWSPLASNPGTSSIANTTSPTTSINAFSTAGTYKYVWTNSFGCKDTVDVVVGNSCGCANAPTVALGVKTGAICAGKTQAISGTFGGSATQVTYSTSGTGTFGTASASASPFNVTYTPSNADTTAGTVNLYVTTNNPLGSPCLVAKDTFVLTINRSPAVSASNSGPYCAGTTIALTGGASGNSYSWSGPLGYTNGTQSPTISNANITMGGTYTITVTSAATCTATASTTVVVNALPAASASGGLPYCQGDTIKLVGGPTAVGNTYQWSGPNSYANGTQSPIILNATPAMSGSYSVTVTNSANCTASANANVVVNAVPVASAANAGPYCAGATIALTGGAGVLGNTYQWSGPLAYSDGTQSPTIAGSTTGMGGTYTITVTNSSSCTATASTNVVVNAAPTASAVNSGPYCEGTTISLTGGANGNASYSWSGPNSYSNGTQSPTITSATTAMSGTYTITVTNLGCTASATTNVVVNALPTPTASSDKSSYCVGVPISLDVNPAASSYSWSGPNGFTDGTKSPAIASAALVNAGLYTVTVTDANTCTAIATVNVVVNPLPSPVAGNTGPYCAGNLILLSVNPSANSYSWSGPNGFSDAGQFPNIASATTANSGTYNVTVTDANNCTASTSTPVVVNAVPAPVNNPQTICNGQSYTTPSGNVVSSSGTYYDTLTSVLGCDSVIITQLTVDIPPYVPYPDQVICEGDTAQLDANVTGALTYTWSNSGTLTDPTIQNPRAFPLVSTTYIVTVTTAQCPAFDTVEVTVNPLPQLNLTTTNTICTANNGTATLQVNSGTPNFNYTWNPANANSPTLTGLGVNTYSVTVTDSKNCSATASNNVGLTTNTVPITLDRIVNIKCNGQSNGEIDVTVGNGTFTYNYAWNPTGQSTEDAFNLSAGSYTLTATDQNGCVDSASFVVTEPTALTLNANTQTDVTCNAGNNGTATVSPTGGSGNYHYIWSDANSQTSATATGLIAGPYTVTVSDDSSCTSVTNFTITEPVAITFGASTTFDVKCNGGNNGSATVVPQNGVGGYQYIWNDAASQSSNPAVNLIAGSYDVTVSDINGCTATTNVVITEPTLLQVQVSGTPITCYGANDGTASAVASGGVVATTYSYSWSNNGSTATIQGLMANTYTVTVQDDNLCTASGSYDVVEPTAIDLTVSATRTSCPTSSDGKVDVLFAGGTGTLTVNLTQNGTTLQSNNNGNFTGVPAGDYTIVVSDGNACSSNKNVTVPAAPFNFFNTAVDSTSCYGTQYKDGHIFVEGTTIDNAPYQYSVDGGAFTYDNDFYQLGAGQHTVTTKDNYGCDTTFTVIVPEPLPASVDILPDDSTLQVGSSLQLYGTLKPYPASSITSYQWSPAEGLSCIDCPNPVATPYHHINEYHLTITYNKGCTAESFVTVYVENNLPLYVPNAFSPNGDGNNDFYLIFGDGIKDLSLKIFNRWGELVFVSTNQQTAWDGRYKGEMQPPGVYVYMVEVTYLDDKVVKKQGSLTLIR